MSSDETTELTHERKGKGRECQFTFVRRKMLLRNFSGRNGPKVSCEIRVTGSPCVLVFYSVLVLL